MPGPLLPKGGPETSPLPLLRRVINGHNDSAKAVVSIDDKLKSYLIPSGSGVATIWSSDEAPADMTETGDRAEIPVPIVNNGTIFRIVDVPPHSEGHMHRTTSLDYIYLVNGPLISKLDDGSRTTLNGGDTLVQRGTMHQWINETDDWCRMVAVLVPALEPVVNGKKLTDASGDISSH